MKHQSPDDLGGVSMYELFRAEAETQTALLTNGILELERGTASAECLEKLMRAAHSLKGAARIVSVLPVERVAHALEDCFEAARRGALLVRQAEIDVLLRGIDVLNSLVKLPEGSRAVPAGDTREIISALGRLASGSNRDVAETPLTDSAASSLAAASSPQPLSRQPSKTGLVPIPPGVTESIETASASPSAQRAESAERVLRLNAENLNRLLGLAGESLVESRWLRPFSESLQKLKRHHLSLAQQLDSLRQQIEQGGRPRPTAEAFNSIHQELAQARQFLSDRIQELDLYDRRSAHLSQRLYLEVLRTRMRPFSDGVRRFPRMVRDLARSLNKQVKLEIYGETTQVDRDILERLETPLAHLLRNAVDHGCELPAVRLQAGKPAECTLRLEARHSAGVLLVSVTDDGAGVDIEQLRSAIIRRSMSGSVQPDKMSETDLLEYLFLPGFTLREAVTEISGRGFGLDIVQNMVRGVRGTIRLQNQPGHGLRVQLQLPLTLSVLRALLVDVAGEPYAVPLSHISRTLKLPSESISTIEGRHYFTLADQHIGLGAARELLGLERLREPHREFSVVVLGDRNTRYGLVVDRFLGERDLVVQPLDPRLGKIQNISAAALMEDGAPVLILDAEDLLRSIEKVLAEAPLSLLPAKEQPLRSPKRVLIVDDSQVVRELERNLLTKEGYVADVASDGAEAWSALLKGHFDLVITDIEMPRMDGIELVRRIKQRPALKKTPVIVISYKDRESDRLRALAAGAELFLAKNSFDDQRLLEAVADLIGQPTT